MKFKTSKPVKPVDFNETLNSFLVSIIREFWMKWFSIKKALDVKYISKTGVRAVEFQTLEILHVENL